MIKNLLMTYENLAPNELRWNSEKTVCCLAKKKGGAKWLHYPLSEDSRAILEKYIQQCIEARGWQDLIGLGADGFSAHAWIEGEEFLTDNARSVLEALLTSYLTAIAAQRPITAGKWRHHKGDVYEIKGVGGREGFKSDYSEGDKYQIEESPETVIDVWYRPQSNEFFYTADRDYSDRVFYHGNSGQWARRVDSFLGLTADGLLRFCASTF